MKTNVFYKKLTSAQLQENLEKQFDARVNLSKYSREQLEDHRNKLRTRIHQVENSAGYNDLLTNETYQKDKAMLELLNTRIKEMLGEDIKKLRDKIDQLSEAKKGVRDIKHAKKPAGTKAAKDYDGDGKIETPKDEVWGSRAKAAAKAGKPFSEAAKECTCGKTKASKENCAVHGKVEEAHDVKDTGYSKRYSKKSSDSATDGGEETSSKKHTNPFDNSAALAAHAKGKKGTVVKGKAQSAKQGKDEEVDESSKPSAGMTKKEKSAVVQKAKAGKDIGKPGKGFAKVEKAAKAGGARDPKAVAAAAMWKQQAKKESIENFRKAVRSINEGLTRLLNEDEEGKAKAITAAGDIVNDYTSWMQRVGQYQTKSMIELADAIRADFGAQQAETFKQAVGPALTATLETMTQQREAISNAVAVLAGEQPVEAPMGQEPEMGPPEEPGMDMSEPDQMNEPADEFGASDAAAGAGSTGREMRESRFARKLAESHSIISKLAK
jgi:hypothetical protein